MSARAAPETAGEMLTVVVADLVRRLDALAPAALADEPDAVHRLRTTVRRLRGVLAGFSVLVARPANAEVRVHLAECGRVLGAARDLEVRIEQLRSVGEEADVDVESLVEQLTGSHATAHRNLVSWWNGASGDALRTVLHGWVGAPPLTDAAERPAQKAAYRALGRQADRTAEAARGVQTPEGAHDLRKAGRRLRHLAEAVTAEPAIVLGKRAEKLGRAGHRLQSMLGDQRDATLLAEHLRAADADGRLVAVCERRAAAAAAGLDDALADLHWRRTRLRDRSR